MAEEGILYWKFEGWDINILILNMTKRLVIKDVTVTLITEKEVSGSSVGINQNTHQGLKTPVTWNPTIRWNSVLSVMTEMNWPSCEEVHLFKVTGQGEWTGSTVYQEAVPLGRSRGQLSQPTPLRLSRQPSYLEYWRNGRSETSRHFFPCVFSTDVCFL